MYYINFTYCENKKIIKKYYSWYAFSSIYLAHDSGGSVMSLTFGKTLTATVSRHPFARHVAHTHIHTRTAPAVFSRPVCTARDGCSIGWRYLFRLVVWPRIFVANSYSYSNNIDARARSRLRSSSAKRARRAKRVVAPAYHKYNTRILVDDDDARAVTANITFFPRSRTRRVRVYARRDGDSSGVRAPKCRRRVRSTCWMRAVRPGGRPFRHWKSVTMDANASSSTCPLYIYINIRYTLCYAIYYFARRIRSEYVPNRLNTIRE